MDPQAFWDAVNLKTPSLILLDVMLPEEDGLQILDKLRRRSDTIRIPVMMLTAKSTEYDKVIALDRGADDYLVKPFGTMELISRIRALLRRSEMPQDTEEYCCGGLFVFPKRHLVIADSAEVVLTLKEFDLLLLMMQHRGQGVHP